MNTWWYLHTATLYQLSCRWTCDDIYIPQLYINFAGDEHVIIYTYRNFISTFLQINTWWYIHTETLYQFSCSCTRDDIYIAQIYFSSRWTRDDIYIPQLYISFPAVEHRMIYIYHNFISIFQPMNTWSYIHTATLYQLFCRWTPDDIYILQLYINFLTVKLLMVYTHCNFIWTFLLMNTWWYIQSGTL